MLKRLKDVFRVHGWADGSLYLAAYVLRRLSFGKVRLIKYYFMAQPVAPRPAGEPRPEGRIRVYRADTLDAVITQVQRPVHRLQARLDRNMVCIAAARGDEFAGYIWLCPDYYEEDEVRCIYRWKPAAKAVWDFDLFIAPQFRLGRLFSRLWEQAHASLRERHVEWTLSRIDAFNSASLTAHRRLGAQTVARGWFLAVGSWQWTLLSAAPYLHFSWSPKQVPELCIELPGTAPQPADGRNTSAAAS